MHYQSDQRFDPQDRLSRTLDHFCERIGKLHRGVTGRLATGYEPPSEVSRGESGLEITLEVPVVDPKDIEIRVRGHELVIKGEKSAERKKTRGTRIVRERYYGSFARSFLLSRAFEPEGVEATVRNGVLTVRIPRTAGDEADVRQIPSP